MTINISIKEQLFHVCQTLIGEKIALAQKGMQDAQSAANNETKSSVGDKYETGRAMMHLEKNKYALQLSEALQLQQQISSIRADKVCEAVEQGALVATDKGVFFVAASLGKVELAKDKYFVISLASPAGQALRGAKVGDAVHFRNIRYSVLELV
jgi:hypothetical protein